MDKNKNIEAIVIDNNDPQKEMLERLKKVDGMYCELFDKLHNIDCKLDDELQDLYAEIHQFRDDFPQFNYAKMFYNDND